MANRSNLLHRPRTWLVLLLAAGALGAPARAFRHLSVPGSAVASFGAIFIAPGLILALTVLRRREFDGVEYFACAYSLSMGLLAVPALAQLAFNLRWPIFDRLFVVVILGLVGLYVFVSVRNPQTPAVDTQPRRPASKPLWLLLILATLVIVPLARESTLDGDTFTYLAYIREMQDTPNMNQREALFGTDIEVAPRSRFNIWVTLPAYLVQVSDIDTVTVAAQYLPPLLALLSLAAFYAFAVALTRRRDFAQFATLVFVLLILTAPFHRETNVSSMVLQRLVADKFMVLLLVLPVQTALTVRWFAEGRRLHLGLMGVTALAISFIHPLIAAFYAIVVGAFGGLHLFAHVRDRAVWQRLGAALLLALMTLSLPVLLRQQTTSSRGDYLFPGDFEDLPLALQPTPVLPFVSVPSWDLRGAGPAIRDVKPEDATGENGVSPFLIWRFRTNMRARRLLLFSPTKYVSHPDLLLELPILLMLLLMPFLVLRLRRPVAQYTVGVTLAVLLMLYNPLITPVVGQLITPWMIWRLTWLFPIALVLAYFAYAPLRGVERLLKRAGRRIGSLAPLVPVIALIGAAVLLRSRVEARVARLELHIGQPAAEDVDVTRALARELGGDVATVLAELDLNVLIPAYISRANVVGHRVNTTSEHFPDSRQAEALGRIVDVEDFFAVDALTSDSLRILRRYGVDYIIAGRRTRLASQLRHLSSHVKPAYQNRAHAVFRVRSVPAASDVIAGYDGLVGEEWVAAQTAFERAVKRDATNVLAWAGLAQVLERIGQPEDAAQAYGRAVELAPDDAWLHVRLARVYESLAQVDLAVREYEKARILDPDDVSVTFTLGDLYRTQEDPERAEATYQAATGRLGDGDSAEQYSQVGDLWFERGLFHRAAEAFARAAELDPRTPRLLRASQAYQVAGDFDRALEVVRRGVARFPWSPILYRQLGAVYSDRGELDAAIDAYERSIWWADLLMDPQVDSYVELANLYVVTDNLDAAVRMYRAAAAVDPYAAAPRIGLGSLMEAVGQPEDALAAYSAAVDADPSNVLGYVSLGRLHLGQQQIDKALAGYRAAVQARPNEDVAHVLLGEAYRQAGRLDAAVRAFRRAIGLRPANVLAHVGLMRTYAAQARLQPALGQAQTAVRIAPGSARAHIALGDVQRILGNSDAALTEYRLAVESEPGYAGAHLALGQAFQTMGRLDEALNEYERAAQLETDSAQIRLALGDAYAAIGQQAVGCGLGAESFATCADGVTNNGRTVSWDQAIEAYQQAIEADSRYVPAYAALTRMYSTLGRPDQALTQAKSTVEANPRSALAYLVLGETQLALGDVESALASYQTAARLAPHDVTVSIALGRVYQFLGQTEDALAQFRGIVRDSPGSIAAHLALGDARLAYGDATSALDAYNAVIRREPGVIAGHLGRSRALLAQGDTEAALQAAEEAIRVRPGDMNGYLAKGTVLERMARFDEAQAQYQRAAALNQASPVPHLALGDLSLSRGRTDLALAAYQTAVNRAPGDPAGWLALADALQSAGQLDTAIAAYEAAASLDKSLPDAWVSLGELYADIGHNSKAAAAFRQALEYMPGDPRAHLGLARLYEDEGQLGLALEQVEAAVEARPGSAQARVALGDLLLRRGEPGRAVTAYQQALRVAPGDQGAGLALVRLYITRGNWDAAAAALENLISARPGDVAPYLALATLQARRGDLQAARLAVVRATQADPGSARALVAQADLEAALGEREAAIESYQRALDLDPSEVGAYQGLGLTLSELERHDEAVRVARSLAELRPDDAGSYLTLGRVLRARDDVRGATEAFQTAIARDPSSTDALDARLRLGDIAESSGDLETAEALYRAAIEASPAAPAG